MTQKGTLSDIKKTAEELEMLARRLPRLHDEQSPMVSSSYEAYRNGIRDAKNVLKRMDALFKVLETL